MSTCSATTRSGSTSPRHPAAVDGGSQPGGQGVRHDRPQHVARLGHDGDVVAVGRIDRPRAEAPVVGGLQHDLHRRGRPAPQVVGEPGRRHQHEVGRVELAVVDRLGVADDPQHVPLARRSGAPAGAPAAPGGRRRRVRPGRRPDRRSAAAPRGPAAAGSRPAPAPGANRPSGRRPWPTGPRTVIANRNAGSGRPSGRSGGNGRRPPGAARRRTDRSPQPTPGRPGRRRTAGPAAPARAGGRPPRHPAPTPPGRRPPAAARTAPPPRRRGRRPAPARPRPRTPPDPRPVRHPSPRRRRRPRRRAGDGTGIEELRHRRAVAVEAQPHPGRPHQSVVRRRAAERPVGMHEHGHGGDGGAVHRRHQALQPVRGQRLGGGVDDPHHAGVRRRDGRSERGTGAAGCRRPHDLDPGRERVHPARPAGTDHDDGGGACQSGAVPRSSTPMPAPRPRRWRCGDQPGAAAHPRAQRQPLRGRTHAPPGGPDPGDDRPRVAAPRRARPAPTAGCARRRAPRTAAGRPAASARPQRAGVELHLQVRWLVGSLTRRRHGRSIARSARGRRSSRARPDRPCCPGLGGVCGGAVRTWVGDREGGR